MSRDIGKKVKELRSKNNLTLQAVSDITGLSIGFLSQFERGLSPIAIDSLEKIADALGVGLHYFFPQENAGRNNAVLRSYEKECYQIVNTGFINYSLSNLQDKNKALTPRLVELLPINNEERIEEYSHHGEEFIYVLEGMLTVFIDSERYDLFPGDSAHYSSLKNHNWANYTNKVVKMIVVSGFRAEGQS